VAIKTILKPLGESAACGFRSWIFAGDIARFESTPSEGDILALYDRTGQRFLAWAFFEGTGALAAKIFSFQFERPFSPELLRARIMRAYQLRLSLGYSPQEAFRVLNAEGDQVPGLVIDWYSGLAVVHVGTPGLWRHKTWLSDMIHTELGAEITYMTCDLSSKAPSEATAPLWIGKLTQTHWPFVLQGRPRQWYPDSHQKTGAYLDQVSNHAKVGALAKHKVVWDLYSHAGGFAVACAQSGAQEVLAIDSSKAALASLHQQAQVLNLSQIQTRQEDIANFFAQSPSLRRPDLIILDPPKLVASRGQKAAGLRHYFKINELALRALAPEGILVSFSCSGRVDLPEWISLITSVLRRNKRQGRIHEILGAGRDHPFDPHLPESHYLKGVILTLSDAL